MLLRPRVYGRGNTRRISTHPRWQGANRCQPMADVRVTFCYFESEAGSDIRGKYGGKAGAAEKNRTFDVRLSKGMLYHAAIIVVTTAGGCRASSPSPIAVRAARAGKRRPAGPHTAPCTNARSPRWSSGRCRLA